MSRRTLVPTLIAAALFAISPPVAHAQAGPRSGAPGPRGAVGDGVAMLERIVENADEIGLTAEQIATLESFREASLARTADARATLEQVRDGSGDVLVEDLRAARELLAEERGLMRDEIAATLTVEQMQDLRDVVGDARARRQAFRGGPAGPRGSGPGGGVGPRQGPGPGPGGGR